jgi:hypothetical protein
MLPVKNAVDKDGTPPVLINGVSTLITGCEKLVLF